MTSNQQFQVEEVSTCLFCQTRGTTLYDAVCDGQYGVPGVWRLLQCPQCRLAWLSPRPLPEELGKIYPAGYYTHVPTKPSRLAVWREKMRRAVYSAVPGYAGLAPGWGWSTLGKVFSLLPPVRDVGTLGTMALGGLHKGRLLDVGCGGGHFLALMRDAGWEVLGVEPDPGAAAVARDRLGIPVIEGTLRKAGLPDHAFDAVTLHHVIEHVHDPIGLLSECRRVLKPGGRLVVVTPNIDSRGHQSFGVAWRDLDPPRHLYIFSLASLRRCAEASGLTISTLRTTARSATFIIAVSRVLKEKGAFDPPDLNRKLLLQGLWFRIKEELALATSEKAGEELFLVASSAQVPEGSGVHQHSGTARGAASAPSGDARTKAAGIGRFALFRTGFTQKGDRRGSEKRGLSPSERILMRGKSRKSAWNARRGGRSRVAH